MSRFCVTHEGRTRAKSIAAIVALSIVVPSLVLGVLLAEESPPIAFEATQVLAKVDSEVILAGDVVLWAMAEFNKVKGKIPSKDRETKYRQALNSQITSLVKVKLLYHQLKKMVPEANVRLSVRETSVIRWTAEGKTTAEISEIMGLSVRTVTFHIGNVVKKLNASNKTGAAVRAAVLGLLN